MSKKRQFKITIGKLPLIKNDIAYNDIIINNSVLVKKHIELYGIDTPVEFEITLYHGVLSRGHLKRTKLYTDLYRFER